MTPAEKDSIEIIFDIPGKLTKKNVRPTKKNFTYTYFLILKTALIFSKV
jgi:hypothetical protein